MRRWSLIYYPPKNEDEQKRLIARDSVISKIQGQLEGQREETPLVAWLFSLEMQSFLVIVYSSANSFPVRDSRAE